MVASGSVLDSVLSSPRSRREWRANVAHDLVNVDPVTNVPLAARVCYNIAGLPFSFQVTKFQDIVSYQDSNVGPLLSALCAFMWFTKVRLPRRLCQAAWVSVARACGLHPSSSIALQVVDEMASCLMTMCAVAQLRCNTTSFVGGVIASVSVPRLLCFLAVQLARLAVASMLCYGGAYFIAHTIGLGDLILNCIALEVRQFSCRKRRLPYPFAAVDRGRALSVSSHEGGYVCECACGGSCRMRRNVPVCVCPAYCERTGALIRVSHIPSAYTNALRYESV